MKIIESENYYERELLPGVIAVQKEQGEQLYINGQVIDDLIITTQCAVIDGPCDQRKITVTFTYFE